MVADVVTLALLAAVSTPSLEPCTLASPGGPATRARCGHVEVPRDRARASAETLAVGFALLPATGEQAAADPIVVLPGGPGQAGTEVAAIVEVALGRARAKRDVVLFDPRGTGRSTRLSCSDDADLATRWSRAPEAERARLLACAAKAPLDPRLITTEAIAHDLEALRMALGAEQLNLVGISYGTRVALTYDRLFPGRARSLILDGVVPASMVIGEHAAADAEAALRALDERCTRTPGCPRAQPLPALLAQLKDRTRVPQRVEVAHPVTGQRLSLPFGTRSLVATVRLLLYAEESAALLPVLLQRANGGDYAPLLAQALLAARLEAGLAEGMQLGVLCAEDVPLLPGSDEGALFGGFVEEIRRVCESFPHADVPASFHDDVPSSTPSLLFSGAADPITPPAWGDAAARLLSRSVHVKARGVGHNVLVRGCAPRLAARFLDEPEPQALDVSCAASLGPFPLFIDELGPAP